jgi:hypothetical protein
MFTASPVEQEECCGDVLTLWTQVGLICSEGW